MHTLTLERITEIAHIKKDVCISIYIPTERAGKETRQNQIRFKNALKKAENDLESQGWISEDIKKILHPAYELHTNSQFFEEQHDGLVVLIAPDEFHVFKSPFTLPELVIVNERFHIKPLIQYISDDNPYYVLALSLKDVRLFSCDKFRCEEIDLEGIIPKSIDEAFQYEKTEPHLQQHSGPQAGNNSAMFHGQGRGKDDKHDREFRFFRIIDKGINRIVKEKQAPLVVAATEEHFSQYKNEANTYQHLFTDGYVKGNPENKKSHDLHAQTWRVVEPEFKKGIEEIIARYNELIATDKVSNNVLKVLYAALHGRVDGLLVPIGKQKWGRYNRDTDEIIVHDTFEPGDEDLFDMLALQTLLTNGKVYPVNNDQLPGNAPVVAVFRY